MVKGWQGWPLSARTVIFFGMLGGFINEYSVPEGCDANPRQQLA